MAVSSKWSVLSIGREKVGSWWNFNKVCNSYHRLYLIVSGEATVRHSGREFRLKAGDLHLLPAGAVIDLSCEVAMEHYYLCFLFKENGVELFEDFQGNFSCKSSDGVYKAFERLLECFAACKLDYFNPYLESSDNISRSEAVISQMDLLEHIDAEVAFRELLLPFVQQVTLPEQQNLDFKISAKRQIDQNYMRGFGREEIAAQLGLSAGYFSQLFRKSFGISFQEALKRKRMTAASQKLLGTNFSVKEISSQCGFADYANFCRQFQTYYGISAGAFRRTYAPEN